MSDSSDGYQLELGAFGPMMGAGDRSTYRVNVMAEGTDFSNPEAVRDVVDSLLRDGDYSVTTRFGNRTASLIVELEAPNHTLLAVAEALLLAEIDKPNTFTWRTPNAPATVFDIVRSWSEFLLDDLDEALRVKRTFRLNLECLPFTRSVDPVTIAWTGPGVQLAPSNSTSGWTVVGAGAIAAYGSGAFQKSTSGAVTVKRTVVAGTYVRLVVDSNAGSATTVDSVTINGTAISNSVIKSTVPLGTHGRHSFLIPTSAYKGSTIEVQFLLNSGSDSTRATLYSMYSVGYPDIGVANIPGGVGVIDGIGSARSGCSIAFTVPTGGAFLYTAPDPDAMIRQRGAGQIAWGVLTTAAKSTVTINGRAMYFPSGRTTYSQLGSTPPQPVPLYPNGVWPVSVDQLISISGSATLDAGLYSFPADTRAKVSFFPTPGAITVISAGIDLPGGYQPGAIAHEEHLIHPGNAGFALLDKNGAPIACTITFYPHWMHHAAR